MQRHTAALVVLLACACNAPVDSGHPERITSARDADANSTHIDVLIATADSLYREDVNAAAAAYTLALDAARRTSDSAGIALALTGLSQTARMASDYQGARRLGEQALDMKQRFGMTAHLFKSFNTLGLIAWEEQRLDDATRLFEQARTAAEATGDSTSIAKVHVNLGLIAKDRAAFVTARDEFEAGLALATRVGDSATMGKALLNLTVLDLHLGDAAGAVLALPAVRQFARLAADSIAEVNAIGQLGVAYNLLGQPQRAIALLDSAITIARRRGLYNEVSENLSVMGDLFREAGDHQHALAYYDSTVALPDSLVDATRRGTVLRNAALSQAALGRFTLAKQSALAARQLHGDAGASLSELADLLVLVTFAQQQRQRDDIDRHLRAARTLVRAMKIPLADVYLGITEAGVAIDAGRPADALKIVDRLGASVALAGSAAEAEVLHLRAQALSRLGRSDSAFAVGRKALAAVERIRGNYQSGLLRTSYASGQARVYETQTMALLDAGRFDEAFETADAARGRSLLDHLGSAANLLDSSATTHDLIAREQLLRRIHAFGERVHEDADNASLRSTMTLASNELRDSLLAARAEFELLVARAGVARVPVAAGVLNGTPNAPEIRRHLAPQELLVEYFVTGQELVIFAMTRDTLQTFRVKESSESLTRRVQLTRDLLQQRDDHASAMLRVLYRLLMEPVRASGMLARANRVIVVPHGALTYLPFAALVNPTSRRYLVQDVALARVPTSASLPFLRERTVTDVPTMRPVEIFAPLPDSLPATRVEAMNVAKAMPDARRWMGEEATEARLRLALGRDGVVHVATHARMDSRNPLFSHLRLSNGRSGPADNGLFEVHEVLALRVSSPLVVLSGCETGLGGAFATGFDAGEDYTTISQALLFAGARNVIATLWRIDDAGAGDFGRRFYAALRQSPPREALAVAQRQMIADRRFSNPYYWAAFELAGAAPDSRDPPRKIASRVR